MHPLIQSQSGFHFIRDRQTVLTIVCFQLNIQTITKLKLELLSNSSIDRNDKLALHTSKDSTLIALAAVDGTHRSTCTVFDVQLSNLCWYLKMSTPEFVVGRVQNRSENADAEM